MTLPSYDVAVIGAGATGSALVIQLVRRLPAGSRILLLGTPRETARGVAYGTALPGHLLNVRAGRMSVIDDEPGHFVRWLADAGRWGGPAAEIAETYLPRPVYGNYVADTLQRAIAAARGRVYVEIVAGTATELADHHGHYIVQTAAGERMQAATLALCLGHGRPEFPIAADAVDPEARARMIADPWSDHRTANIGPDDRVLAVGTGLTMVDQVLALAARGHRGPITALSRRGHLPSAHRARRSEPRTIDLPAGPLSTRTLVRLVVAAARDDIAAGGDWRAVVDGLRPVTQDAWRRLGHAERRRFCRHIESLWSSVRHRMAPEVAARLDALRSEAQLTVRAGRVVAVKATPRGLVVAIRARGGRTAELAGFDWMLNCAGTGRFAVSALEAPFGPLVAAGLLTADRLGRGIEVTPRGEAVGRDGTASPGLYALGPLGAGSLQEITAMPDIREQCAAAAQRIADRVGSPSLPAAWSRSAVVRLRG